MSKIVTVSIVNWNGMKYLPSCLESVYKQNYKGKIEIIIVDNFSQDGSLEYLEKNHNGIKMLKNTTNKGFSYAHNQAIRESKGEYILPLNFDVFLEPDFITEMVKLIDSDPRIGIISGKLYKQINGDKTKIIDSTGIIMEHCFMRPRGELEEDIGQYDGPDNFKVFGACGAAPFYRRAMLEDVKCFNEYFDEDFINYVEDVDLSWRAQIRGWHCIYNPRAIAYHERGVTRKNNGKMKNSYLIYGFRNRNCCILKNMPLGYWKKYKFKIIGRELLFYFYSIREIPRIVRLKALFLTLGMFPKMLVKRIIIQKKKLISDDYLDKLLSYGSFDFKKLALFLLRLELKNVKSKFRIRNNPDGK